MSELNRQAMLDAIVVLATALMDSLPGDSWHVAHAIVQCARGEITPKEALEVFEE
jgi:hypothetical protein